MAGNNKGFSLVELIVALAIFSIAGVAVFSFAVNSSNTYRRSNTEIKLQYEQQMAVNQIRDMIVESDKGIYFDEASKTLALYSAVKTDMGVKKYPVTVIRFNKSEGKMYFGTREFSSVSDISFSDVTDLKLLAEDVEEFNVDLTKVKKNRVLFQIVLKIGDTTQTLEETVALRNRLVISNQADTIWGGDAVLIDSFIKGISICRDTKTFSTGQSDIIGKNGEEAVIVAYSAKVTANEESNREYAVSWSIEGGVEGISVSEDGEVSVFPSVAPNTMFSLKAVSVDDPSKSTYINIHVAVSAVYPKNVTLELSDMTEENGYCTYTLVPTLHYTDGSTVKECGHFSWMGLDSLPEGCSFNNKTGKLTLLSSANGCTFTVRVQANERDSKGQPILSNEVIIIAKDIPEYVTGPSVSISVASSLSRGGEVSLTMVFENTDSSLYNQSWNVEPYYDSESTKWGSVDNSDFDLISLSENAVLDCAEWLNWSKEFKIKVSGTATDKEGNVFKADSKIVTIPPVEIIITPTSDNTLWSEDKDMPLLTDSILRYEDWNWDGKGIQNDCGTRRRFELRSKNLIFPDNGQSGCRVEHNYQFQNWSGELLKLDSVEKPRSVYEGKKGVCGFEASLNKWERLANRPGTMAYSVMVKDDKGNMKVSNTAKFLIAYEVYSAD